MNLWQSSQKPCLKGLPGKHPIGTNLSKPHSDQESLHRAYAPLSNGDGRPGNCIFTWSRRRAGGTKPTGQPSQLQNRTNRQTKQSQSKTNRQTKKKPRMLDSEPRTIKCHPTEVRQGVETMPSRFKDYVINIVHSLRPV